MTKPFEYNACGEFLSQDKAVFYGITPLSCLVFFPAKHTKGTKNAVGASPTEYVVVTKVTTVLTHEFGVVFA